MGMGFFLHMVVTGTVLTFKVWLITVSFIVITMIILDNLLRSSDVSDI